MTPRLRVVHISTVLVVLVLLVPGQGSSAAQVAEGDIPPVPRQFDNDSALKYSQAAIGRTVGDYMFLDREGRPVRLSGFRGRPLVISLIYTSCYHICPTTTRNLAKAVDAAREILGPNSFRVITIGFDTGNDTPQAMRSFARLQGIDIPGWHFLSADKATIDALSRDLGFQYFPSPKGFDHLIQATVVDAEGKVYRQVYGMSFNLPLLVNPLKELVLDQPSDKSLFSTISDRVRLFCTVYDAANNRYYFDYSLFVGIAIGAIILVGLSFWLIREWRRSTG